MCISLNCLFQVYQQHTSDGDAPPVQMNQVLYMKVLVFDGRLSFQCLFSRWVDRKRYYRRVMRIRENSWVDIKYNTKTCRNILN